jgi:hypothetical protein
VVEGKLWFLVIPVKENGNSLQLNNWSNPRSTHSSGFCHSQGTNEKVMKPTFKCCEHHGILRKTLHKAFFNYYSL